MDDIFYTIKGAGSSQYKEKMSRFLSFVHPAAGVDEAKAIVKDYKNKYHDARHVCWAYMIGPERTQWQLNDDGEPSGTAGKPILGQINSAGITNCVLIVVRYFGGIKLGTSGLTAAYREAARLAIEDAGIRELHRMKRASVEFSYETADAVMRVAKQPDVTVVEKTFDNLCHIVLEYPLGKAEEVEGRLMKVEGLMLESTEM